MRNSKRRKYTFIPQIRPYFDFDEEKELVDTIRTGWLSEWKKVRKFEKMISSFLKTRYVHLVPNGTLAITAACLAAGLKPGKEVIIPDITMAGTANGILLAGLKPVFVDITDNLTVDPVSVVEKITSNTCAIIPVHINGRSAHMRKILKIARENNLVVIEDAAQAFGSKLGSKFLGTYSDFGCFSFSIPKIVTMGQGGAVVTNTKKLSVKIAKIKDHGRRAKGLDIHDSIGYNLRITEMQAAIGIAQFRKLKINMKRKRKIFRYYKQLLSDLPEVKFIETNLDEVVPWFVDVLVEKRNQLADFLKRKGIETRVIYPPMHTHKAYREYCNFNEKFPIATKVSRNVLWLPSSVDLVRTQIGRVSQEIKNFFRK